MSKLHFVVVSLGNPLPKYASLHSAGHFVLAGLPKHLRQPTACLQEGVLGKQRCMLSRGGKYTLVQSPTYMNTCGGWVSQAWTEIAKEHDPRHLGLVILHDELERDFGIVRMVPWDRSAKGHNGLKSVKNSLSQKTWPESPLVRIAIGIGRPEQRDSDSVSKYVLSPIEHSRRRHLEESTPYEVVKCLAELEHQWSKPDKDK